MQVLRLVLQREKLVLLMLPQKAVLPMQVLRLAPQKEMLVL